GSQQAPWQTLQYAVDSVHPGDLILVESGVYAGFRITQSGTDANKITLAADRIVLSNGFSLPGTVRIEQPGPLNQTGADIELVGARDWTLLNLTVAKAPGDGVYLQGTDRTHLYAIKAFHNQGIGIHGTGTNLTLIKNSVSVANAQGIVFDSTC